MLPPGVSIWEKLRQLSRRLSRPSHLLLDASAKQVNTPSTEFSGQVMGTFYRLTLGRLPRKCDPERFHQAAVEALLHVEALMSAYRADSEVSAINSAPAGEWLPLSPETATVINEALNVGRWSAGAYDITVAPLVNLWGFGPNGAPGHVPTDHEIEVGRRHTGVDQIEVRLHPPAIRKQEPAVHIDLAGIAKGFGVDQAAEALNRARAKHYCLEVGGEIRTRGLNQHGRPWQIAIETPASAEQRAYRNLGVSNRAVATSGDYRIYFESGGQRYSHVIDPRTGRPIQNQVASVTVVHSSCVLADAWATALMVSGSAVGLELAAKHGIAALFIIRTDHGFEELATEDFHSLG